MHTWMIEKREDKGSHSGIWWVSGTSREGGRAHFIWTRDPNKGIRFENAAAAKAIATGFCHGNEFLITEHDGLSTHNSELHSLASGPGGREMNELVEQDPVDVTVGRQLDLEVDGKRFRWLLDHWWFANGQVDFARAPDEVRLTIDTEMKATNVER